MEFFSAKEKNLNQDIMSQTGSACPGRNPKNGFQWVPGSDQNFFCADPWLKRQKFKMITGTWNFFSEGNFYRTFRIWAHNLKKNFKLTRERKFVHFLYFREDWSDRFQTLPKYKKRHLHQKSRKKVGNIYGHLARIAIWNFKKLPKFQNLHWNKFCYCIVRSVVWI